MAIPISATVEARGGSLESGLAALDSGDVERARAIREGLPARALDRNILAWLIAMSGRPGVPAAEIAEVIDGLSNWPAQGTLRANLEEALLRELDADQLALFFASDDPRTVEGRVRLARVLASSDRARAADLIAPVWQEELLGDGEDSAILGWAEPLLSERDHRRRIAMLLYRDRIRAAERLTPLAGPGAAELVKAVAAVTRRVGEDAALAAVPEAYRSDPLYLFAKARHLRRQERQRAAAATLSEHRFGAEAAVGTRDWWEERRLLARQLLDQGDARLAYDVVRLHNGGRATDIIEAEFTAGWIALRFLDDAAAAKAHFEALLETGTRSLSVSRGRYWLGRAQEALGDAAAARSAFEAAAAYRTTFYGQLAMERLGRSDLSIRYPSPSESDRAAFAANTFSRVIARLEELGEDRRARTFYRHLIRKVPNAEQAAILTARAERNGQFQLGLQLGKSALARGLDAEALAFPTGAIPSDAPLSEAGRSLAYAIARQESAFDREAVSGAGARGLLQLMPATAREVAGQTGLPYSRARLTSDPGYNAQLGASFLSRLLDRFDQSYVLMAAAYNAGPTRAIRWREQYGDPVGRPIDEIVDWIERIPFTETRNYVQRVMENYQVYRARLDGRPLRLEADLRFGRAQQDG